VKLAELSIVRAAAVVAAVVVGVKRVIAAVAAAVAIYRSVYFCGFLYSTNAYQYTYPLGLKFYIKVA
jgi:hypothetical protein